MQKRVSQGEVDRLVEELDHNQFTHPLMKAACRELGLTIDQLWPKTAEHFNEPLQQVHFEARRKAQLALIARFILQHSTSLTSRRGFVHSSCSIDDWSAHKVAVEMKKLQKLLRVRENLKHLQANSDERKKDIQTRLEIRQQKASADKQQIVEELKAKAEVRDQKIRTILETKYKTVAQHEILALKQRWNQSPPRPITCKTPQKRHSSRKASEGPDIDTKIRQFEEKMMKSIYVRDQDLRQRSSCGFREESAAYKAKANKAHLDKLYEEQLVNQILKIQAKEEASKKRRETHLAEESKKVSTSLHTNNSKSLADKDFHRMSERAAARKTKRIEEARKRKMKYDEKLAQGLAERLLMKKLNADQELRKKKGEEEIRKQQIMDRKRMAEEKVKKLREAEDLVAQAKSSIYLTLQQSDF